jgi:ABC-type phosphate transport system substrate-binding protein
VVAGGALAQQQVGIAVVAHPAVPLHRMGAAELAAVFTGGMKNWKDGSTIRIFNAPSGSPLRTEFDGVVLNMTPEQVSRFWIDKRIRGEGTPPRQVPSPDLVYRLVTNFPGSIGYVPEDKVATGVRVLARIRNRRVLPP